MAKREYRVNVHESQDLRDDVVARVRYNQDLDYWDGNNNTNGGIGMHKGITKLKDGRYVIIIGSQWQGAKDYAYIVSAEEALQEILKSDNGQLLNTKKFVQLKMLYEGTMVGEEEDEA